MRRSTRQRVRIAAFLSFACVATTAIYCITNNPFDQSATASPEAIGMPLIQQAADSAIKPGILANDAAQHDVRNVSY